MAVLLPALRQVRERAAMTQFELAGAAGLHPITIADLERLKNGANPKTVRALARALHVKPADLMQESQP